MAIELDHQLREQIPKNNTEFQITYLHDELAAKPIFACDALPYTVFRCNDEKHSVLNRQISEIYHAKCSRGDCYEMLTHRSLDPISA